MRTHSKLAPDVDLSELSVQTKNFSGAEIEGLVRAAQSTAMNRLIKVKWFRIIRGLSQGKYGVSDLSTYAA